MPFGAEVLKDGRGVRFRLYAPGNRSVDLILEQPQSKMVPMDSCGDGWFERIVADAATGTTYRFQIGELVVPDPASRFAPEGVHGSSRVEDPEAFTWPETEWSGRPWGEHVFYEVHVGTFTAEGTYAAAQSRLEYLHDLGVTAVELMPLAEAPGRWNWGYDGVLPFAPSHNYGTPDELKAFVAAAHALKIAVYLDVVYNHFGPEANYLHAFAKRFYTDRIQTPWGAAIDVIDDDREDVRAFFFENALYWLEEFRFDGLRLDAVHEIYDGPSRRFLRELANSVAERVDRPVNLILENEKNEASLLESSYRAQWADDLHNALHVAITGQTEGYYADFADRNPERIARALTEGFVYQGEPSKLKNGEPRGEPSADLELASFVTFLQNHDQVGNRPFGDRITRDTPVEAVHAAAAIVLLAPATPMLFMGEEWGASSPFLFFCDFEPELAAKVTEGRRAEFADFAEFADPEARERIPDPSAESTFVASKLNWDERGNQSHAQWLRIYKTLLQIRQTEIVGRVAGVCGTDAQAILVGEAGLCISWHLSSGETLLLDANLSGDPVSGFSAKAAGRVIYATHGNSYADGIAPGWSVRWTIS